MFFEHIPDAPKLSFPFKATILWKPDTTTEAFLRADWERVDAKVRHGVAHELVASRDGIRFARIDEARVDPGVEARREPLRELRVELQRADRFVELEGGLGRMPHVASNVVDEKAVKLIGDWIKQLPKESN